MRFKRKPKPLYCDIRRKKKFLLFPRRIGNQIVWLEKVVMVCQYYRGHPEDNYLHWYFDRYELIEKLNKEG